MGKKKGKGPKAPEGQEQAKEPAATAQQVQAGAQQIGQGDVASTSRQRPPERQQQPQQQQQQQPYEGKQLDPQGRQFDDPRGGGGGSPGYQQQGGGQRGGGEGRGGGGGEGRGAGRGGGESRGGGRGGGGGDYRGGGGGEYRGGGQGGGGEGRGGGRGGGESRGGGGGDYRGGGGGEYRGGRRGGGGGEGRGGRGEGRGGRGAGRGAQQGQQYHQERQEYGQGQGGRGQGQRQQYQQGQSGDAPRQEYQQQPAQFPSLGQPTTWQQRAAPAADPQPTSQGQRQQSPPQQQPGYQQMPQGQFPPQQQPGYQQMPQGQFPPQQQQQQMAYQGQVPQHGGPPVPQQAPVQPSDQVQQLPQQAQPRAQPQQAGGPPRSGQGSVQKLTSDVEQLQLVEAPAHFRQGGTQGRKIGVLANHYEMKLAQNLTTAYQYDVEITPDKPKKLLPVVMEQMKRLYYPNNSPAFDGMKNLFSAKKLPISDPFTGTVRIQEDTRENEYKVKIQWARDVDLSLLVKFFNQRNLKTQNHMLPPMHVLQCLDVVLRSGPSVSMITAGRSYFNTPDRITVLGSGMEMYRGFYQSAILGWKPFLNVDVSHKAFPMQINVIDLILEIDDRADVKRELNRFTAEKLGKFLYNLKVEYLIPNQPASKRVYRVNGIEANASYFTFTNDAGRKLTVAEYFSTEKRFNLKFPHLPCLWVGSKVRKPKMVLPCELCKVLSGQVTNRKMDENQTRNMIRQAATNTETRKGYIANSMRVANHNASPSMKEFGLSVDAEMARVNARVLTPPTIKYNGDRIQTVGRGVWRGGIFLEAMVIKNWAILCCDERTDDRQLNDMRDLFVKQGRSSGMNISSDVRPDRLSVNQRNNNSQRDVFNYFEQCKKNNLQLIVVVLQDFVKSCYSWVKKAAELKSGCLTQCIKSGTMRRMNTQTVDNILLKINAKLNGKNHILGTRPSCMTRPVMIMGADVTHPSPECRGETPSVAAVTASHDPQAFCYNIVWRLQDPRAEIITDLQEIMREQLLFFRQKTNCKPERIIFFRDGVSDGQFEAVRRQEVQAMRNACASLEAGTYQPAITFLVVQKRHHTRLFPANPRDSEDKNVNVPAGTIVDTLITHPTAQDFYLVSHASIQGVAKPTKYRTIWDDSNMSDDEVEQLTYYLCHLFARCNRSVSYPAPTYYAHLAAARAKVYCEEERLDMLNLKKAQEKFPIMKVIQKDHPMFFV